MSTQNPEGIPPETQKLADTRTLELIEFSLSQTEAEARAKVNDRPPRLRHLFWMHRFQVMTWLLQNGVSIPVHLICDQAHAKVGKQSVDAPVEPETEPETPTGK